jgi:hypothetical protein
VHLLNLRPTHQPTFFFLGISFKCVFERFSATGVHVQFKNTIQIFLQKVHVENFFLNPFLNPKLVLDIFLKSCFWAFLGEGSSKKKHTKTSGKINPTLVLFWPLTHPPTTGVTEFFCGPLFLVSEHHPSPLAPCFYSRGHAPASDNRQHAGAYSIYIYIYRTIQPQPHKGPGKGPPKTKIGDPRGGWVGQSTKKD